MRSDLLLEWMSETGEGTTADLRQRVKWLARTFDRNPSDKQAGWWLRDASSLGHAEIDWSKGRWAVAPSAAVLLPSSGGTAVLTGRRPPGLVEKLAADERGLSVESIPPLLHPSQDGVPPPTSVYIQADSIEQLETAVVSADVQFVGCAARDIAARLPQLMLGAPAAPPAWEAPTEHYVPRADVPFQPGPPSGDGLCQVTVQGRKRYLYRRGTSWFSTDRADGILWAIAESGASVTRWRQDRTEADEAIGTVFVDQGAALPPLQSRALVLCSGMTAQFSKSAGTAIYKNVPWSIINLVADSIRQQVAVID